MLAARESVMLGLPLAQQHLDYFVAGSGADYREDVEDFIRRDSKVRSKLAGAMKSASTGHFKIEQSDYDVKDFQYAFAH